jgi:hypothetical protein
MGETGWSLLDKIIPSLLGLFLPDQCYIQGRIRHRLRRGVIRLFFFSMIHCNRKPRAHCIPFKMSNYNYMQVLKMELKLKLCREAKKKHVHVTWNHWRTWVKWLGGKWATKAFWATMGVRGKCAKYRLFSQILLNMK